MEPTARPSERYNPFELFRERAVERRMNMTGPAIRLIIYTRLQRRASISPGGVRHLSRGTGESLTDGQMSRETRRALFNAAN